MPAVKFTLLRSISPIVIVGIIVGCAFVGLQWLGASIWESGLEELVYVRSAIGQGQFWRLLSGHFVHFTQYHAVMNGAGLALVCWALLYRQSLLFFLCANLFLPLWISVGTWLFVAEVDQYRGYSGVIHGLVAAGLILEWQYNKVMCGIAGLLLTGKIIYEHLPGYDVNYLISEIGVPVGTEAHLLGFIGGCVLGLCALIFQRRLRNLSHTAAN